MHVNATNTRMLLMIQLKLRNVHTQKLLLWPLPFGCQLLPFALYYLPIWLHVLCASPAALIHAHTRTHKRTYIRPHYLGHTPACVFACLWFGAQMRGNHCFAQAHCLTATQSAHTVEWKRDAGRVFAYGLSSEYTQLGTSQSASNVLCTRGGNVSKGRRSLSETLINANHMCIFALVKYTLKYASKHTAPHYQLAPKPDYFNCIHRVWWFCERDLTDYIMCLAKISTKGKNWLVIVFAQGCVPPLCLSLSHHPRSLNRFRPLEICSTPNTHRRKSTEFCD